MIEEIAVSMGCNPSPQDPVLCMINTALILPGIFGLFFVMVLYFIAVPMAMWIGASHIVQVARDKINEKRHNR